MTTTVLVIFNILICIGRGVGEGVGYSRKFYTGRLCSELQPLTLLYNIFGRKGTSFLYFF